MQNEQKHLSMVLEKLRIASEELLSHLSKGQQEILKMKRYYWENRAEFDEFKYEEITNRQMINAELDAANERLKQYRLYEKLLDSPYFGRIDFVYEGEDKQNMFIWNGTEKNRLRKHFPILPPCTIL